MKVLVIGANGQVGQQVVNMLHAGLSEKSIESTLGSALFSVFRVQKNRPFL
ncbi:hypothetical protein [Aeribacillus sp. FSL k6-2211]